MSHSRLMFSSLRSLFLPDGPDSCGVGRGWDAGGLRCVPSSAVSQLLWSWNENPGKTATLLAFRDLFLEKIAWKFSFSLFLCNSGQCQGLSVTKGRIAVRMAPVKGKNWEQRFPVFFLTSKDVLQGIKRRIWRNIWYQDCVCCSSWTEIFCFAEQSFTIN